MDGRARHMHAACLAPARNECAPPPRARPAPQAVLVPSHTIPTSPTVEGYDFNGGRDLDGLMAAMMRSGFQATALGQAVEEVDRMARRPRRGGGGAGRAGRAGAAAWAWRAAVC
jgi:hypothetical protein